MWLQTAKQTKPMGKSDIINHLSVFISLLRKSMTLIGNVLQNLSMNHLQKYEFEEVPVFHNGTFSFKRVHTWCDLCPPPPPPHPHGALQQHTHTTETVIRSQHITTRLVWDTHQLVNLVYLL